jgi:hypothetical protein
MKLLLNKIPFLVGGIIVVMIAIFVSQLIVKNNLEADTSLDRFISLENGLSWKYFPLHEDLNIIVLRLKNAGVLSKQNYQLQIYQGDQLLFKQTFSGINVNDPSDLRFQFAPLTNIKDEELTLKVFPESKDPHPLQIGTNENEVPSMQVFYRNHQLPAEFSNKILNPGFLLVWIAIILLLVYA